MNWSKLTAFYIGSMRGRDLRPMANKGLSWSLDIIHYLGIKYPIAEHLQQQIFELNFGNNLAKIKTIINIWSARHLTLLGKITIIKSLVIPILTLLTRKLSLLLIEISKKFIQELNKTLFHFVWGSKWERVSRLKLCRSLLDGGANMLNFLQIIIMMLPSFSLPKTFFTRMCPWKYPCVQKKLLLLPSDNWREFVLEVPFHADTFCG